MSLLGKIFGKLSSSKEEHKSVTLVETMSVAKERTIEVKGMSDEKVKETIDFIANNCDDTSYFSQVSVKRNGGSVLITLPSVVGIFDFANWVNNFVWADADGQRFEAVGHYPLGEAQLGGEPVNFSNSDLEFYIPQEEEDPACVHYKTAAGESYRYDF